MENEIIDHSWNALCNELEIDPPIFHGAIARAYTYGVRQGEKNVNTDAEIGKILTSFLQKIYTYRNIVLHSNKVMEGLSLIDTFCRCPDYDNYEERLESILYKMENWR